MEENVKFIIFLQEAFLKRISTSKDLSKIYVLVKENSRMFTNGLKKNIYVYKEQR